MVNTTWKSTAPIRYILTPRPPLSAKIPALKKGKCRCRPSNYSHVASVSRPVFHAIGVTPG